MGPDQPDEPELPEQTRDDTDTGWGEPSRDEDESRRDQWLEEQRPPHHGG